MKIKTGFDAKRAAQNRTGLGNYSRFVLRILSQRGPQGDYHLYIPNPDRTPYLKDMPTLKPFRLHFPRTAVWRRLRSLWRVWGVTADIRRDGIQLYHGLSNELPLNIRRARCRSVVTVHDLIFLHCPEYYHAIDRLIYNYKFRRACRKADRVIAVSEYTKREIMRYYGVAEEKIDVVYQGCDTAFATPIDCGTLESVRKRYGLPERFILYVGSIERRKNLMLVAKALKSQADHGRGAADMVPVVAVGKRTGYEKELRAYIGDNGLSGYFSFLHYVPFADLPAIYRLATVFVYPSRIEGFGIPMLEAISSGVPAIGCTGSCLEEAGGPGSIYTDPDDAVGMGRAIAAVCDDSALRQRMTEDGMAYARNFTDGKLCADLLETYRKAMG